MEKIKVIYGMFIGFGVSFLGVYLFLEFFTEYSFFEGIEVMKTNNSLGKLITLGCILNLSVFFLMLKIKQDLIAKGIVLSAIFIAISTIFL